MWVKIPVSIISDLDVRSLEYYEDEKVPKITLVDNAFIARMKTITEGIDYSSMPEYFTNSTAFNEFVNDYKTLNRFPNQPKGTRSIKEQLTEAFKAIDQHAITNEIIEEIRKKKKKKIEAEWLHSENVKMYLPIQWTLEYEIASSKLSKYLLQAIKITSIEKSCPASIIDEELFTTVKNEIETEFAEKILSNQDVYAIFKPLSNGIVSKASTAQYLAEILEKADKADEKVKEKLQSDPYLKYIRDAIYHVTEPEKEDE